MNAFNWDLEGLDRDVPDPTFFFVVLFFLLYVFRFAMLIPPL